MTSSARRSDPDVWQVLGVLFVLSPVLVPLLVVVVLAVVFFAAMVAEAFGEGFAVGCGALAALIGIPSVVLLWLSKALPMIGIGRRPAREPQHGRVVSALVSDMEARYRAGDFIHRDYEAERREWFRE